MKRVWGEPVTGKEQTGRGTADLNTLPTHDKHTLCRGLGTAVRHREQEREGGKQGGERERDRDGNTEREHLEKSITLEIG